MTMNGGSSSTRPAEVDTLEDGAGVKRRRRETRKMAYLGPPGTYGQQAAQDFALRLRPSSTDEPIDPSLSDIDIELVPYPSIAAVYSADTDYRVLPLENTIHGIVTETLDCLLSPLPQLSSGIPKLPEQPDEDQSGSDLPVLPYVVGDTVLKIQHLLVALKGVTMSSVTYVRSHEQALGQSSVFLSTHLPGATLHPWPSTAGAVSSLFSEPVPENTGNGAAICSRAAYELYLARLDILHEGTQSVAHNYTRFVLLSRPKSPRPSSPSSSTSSSPSTSPSTSFYLAPSASALTTLLASLAPTSHIRAVHGKPAPDLASACDPFPRRFLVEVGEEVAGVDKSHERRDVNEEGGSIHLGTFLAYSIN